MKDRDELVELMARAYVKRVRGSDYETMELDRQGMIRALDALGDAGCTVVPNEATEEMVSAASGLSQYRTIAAAFFGVMAATSPYRRKP